LFGRLLKLACGAALVVLLSFGAGSVGAAQEPNGFVCQLQRINLEATGKTKFDLVIMVLLPRRLRRPQVHRRGDSHPQDEPLRSQDRPLLHEHRRGGRRWYWQRGWDKNRDGRPDAAGPAWLGRSNPNWPGNYKVRYWDEDWQQIVYEYVDKVLDGVYLDIVDAYQYWKPREPSVPIEDEIVGYVEDIATYARVTQDYPEFQVFVQNAEELSQHSDYVQAVSGIGKEDPFYNGNRRQHASEVEWSVNQLDRFKAAGKPVLVTDYVTERPKIVALYEKAHPHGYVPYATRQIKHFTTPPGFARRPVSISALCCCAHARQALCESALQHKLCLALRSNDPHPLC
jgi:hypothetical protein